jgi:3-oxoacyl-[acyl-carrier-protein] synthase-3
MMVAAGGRKRVLLLVGDTISKLVHEDDRATALLFGDCGTATLVEAADAEASATFVLGTDGGGGGNLIVPQGGFRADFPADPRNSNPQDKLFMEGGEILTFTLAAVPPLIKGLISASGTDIADYDAFLLHQANSFMIKHLSKKAKLPADKVPINMDRFGNTTSATLPLLLATDCSALVKRPQGAMLAMVGFGVGYSWAGCAMRVGPLQVADLITA